MQSTARLELEIDVLKKRRQALESDLTYKRRQHAKSMPCDDGMSDPDVALLLMSSLVRDRDRLDFEIAQKKIDLYDLLGAPSNDEDVPVSPPSPAEEVGRRMVTGGTAQTPAGFLLLLLPWRALTAGRRSAERLCVSTSV